MPEQYLSQTQQQRLQMVLAPQLRQSLELLQVPILELQTLVQQELQQNPTLEEKIEAKDPIEVEPGNGENEENSNEELDFAEEFEVLAKLDDEWRDYFNQNQPSYRRSREAEERREYFLNSLSQSESLQEHLMQQLTLTALDEDERLIGEMLIGSINDDGYLTTPLEELAASTGYPLPRIQQVLHIIQEFDPIGVGAADLRECLLLQLRRLGKGDSLAARIVEDHLDELGARKYPDIARALKLTAEDIQQQAKFIATLEPRPGRLFSAEQANYVLPEVVIQKVDGEFVVLLDNDQVPHLRISRHYRRLMANPNTPAEVKKYIREKVRAGAFLIKSINQRQDTIFRIANEIVRVQGQFFEHGISHLKPLTMAEVADQLGVHETTVSRAIANKYMQTPQGTFEAKYFFTPGYKTSDGKNISNKTIKDAISRMVEEEDPSNPLSDQAMAKKLKEEGIKVARRTIAKYRDELKILPSHLRKSY